MFAGRVTFIRSKARHKALMHWILEQQGNQKGPDPQPTCEYLANAINALYAWKYRKEGAGYKYT